MSNVDKLTDKLLEVVEKIEGFTVEQSPQVVKELIAFKKVESYANIAFYSIVSLFLMSFVALTFYLTKCDLTRAIVSTIVGIVTLILSSDILCEVLFIVKLKIAPKLFIVDYLRNRGD